MKIILKEYNVVPNMEERNELNIEIIDDRILYNNQIINGDNKLEHIINLINEYKEDIVKLNNDKIGNFKGGRQKLMNIQFYDDNRIYTIIGNTPSIESANLYNIIKEKLLSIVEE